MLRSLWSGVTGLQAHQIAMDVESNNIANVNTVGFKYSRANFADMLSQTNRVATAPTGNLGGQNAMQIGLGVTAQSTTRIFSQGTLQTTDKNTDLALQGDGFFIVSNDGGSTHYYTRNGDFVRDRAGNFVNNAGYVAQGWLRDDETATIDSTGPVKNIVIPEGLTTPARATTVVSVKANLDSGNSIGTRSTPIYALDSVANGRDFDNDGVLFPNEIHAENDVNSDEFYTNSRNEQILTERGVDLGVLFNEVGDGVALRRGQGLWISYANAESKKVKIGQDNPAFIGKFGTIDPVTGVFTPQAKTLDIVINGVSIQSTNAVASISDVAALINAQYNITGVRAEISEGNKLTLINRNNSGTTDQSKNIHLVVNAGDGTDIKNLIPDYDANDPTKNRIDIITAHQYEYTTTSTTAVHGYNTNSRQVNTTEDLRRAMQEDARKYVDYDGSGSNIKKDAQTVMTNIKTKIDTAINGGTDAAAVAKAAEIPELKPLGNEFLAAYYRATNSGEDHATALNTAKDYVANLFAFDDYNDGVTFSVNTKGQFELKNPANSLMDRAIYLSVTGRTTPASPNTPAINENVRLTTMMKSLEGSLTPGQAVRTSSAFMMSSHGSTTEIYDSLGSKHTVNIRWAKTGTTNDGGTEWNMVIQVPEPAEINFSGNGPANVITGMLRFGPDGALSSFNPASFTFTANNGSQAGQSVQLNFGLNTDFNGLTSFDRDSSTDYIRQDGYEGGSLKDLRIDETGTIIGAFTNGQSFGLAQIAVATFTNNEGLHAEGGNIFSRTANSGDPVVGTAGSGNKGTIAAAKLEQSNVDLSRSLTQLIVVQRGFQANSKAITTSDEMLNTLLQLKN
ncbi:hypothetical protein LMG7974_01232 [Campylobacter majalis]|uniref:Flagellar hook protein FlgE n=1 Tax=Campylobacter majalis TaxID=2790656 RepID=A0ABM8Q7W8_9BACT|nr:flagellar hook protein FlgE [Campylobacter majalis]CAD7288921.1 hypothetical protein LMG7974_01232 [Campylobacter majalis]